jgi:hypothetical protein
MKRLLVGVFPSSKPITEVIGKLKSAGLDSSSMSVIVRESESYKVTNDDGVGKKIVEGTAEGVATGGLLGALAGLLIGTGIVTIPGIGALLIGGPLISALGLTGAAATTAAGALTGGVAGGLVGSLVKLGFSQEEAKVYYDKLSAGSSLIMLTPPDSLVDVANRILSEEGATEIRSLDISDNL